VSDPFHMARLRILATQLGIVPYTSPTRSSPISSNRQESWRYVLLESLKLPIALLMRPRRSAEVPTGRLEPDEDSLRAWQDSVRRDSLGRDSLRRDSLRRDSTARDSSGDAKSKPLVRPSKPRPPRA